MRPMNKCRRRSRAAMRSLRAEMKQLEEQGKSRKEIAFLLAVTQAQVTKGLGSVRRWRDRRIALTCAVKH